MECWFGNDDRLLPPSGWCVSSQRPREWISWIIFWLLTKEVFLFFQLLPPGLGTGQQLVFHTVLCVKQKLLHALEETHVPFELCTLRCSMWECMQITQQVGGQIIVFLMKIDKILAERLKVLIWSESPFIFHSFMEEFMTKTKWRTNLKFYFQKCWRLALPISSRKYFIFTPLIRHPIMYYPQVSMCFVSTLQEQRLILTK